MTVYWNVIVGSLLARYQTTCCNIPESWSQYLLPEKYLNIIKNFKIDIGEIGLGNVDWLGWGLEQVAGSCKYNNDLSGSMKCGEFLYWNLQEGHTSVDLVR